MSSDDEARGSFVAPPLGPAPRPRAAAPWTLVGVLGLAALGLGVYAQATGERAGRAEALAAEASERAQRAEAAARASEDARAAEVRSLAASLEAVERPMRAPAPSPIADGARLPPPPIEAPRALVRRGVVALVAGAAPVAQGDSCEVTLTPGTRAFPCDVIVRCAERLLLAWGGPRCEGGESAFGDTRRARLEGSYLTLEEDAAPAWALGVTLAPASEPELGPSVPLPRMR